MEGALLGLLVVVVAQAEAEVEEPEVKVEAARAEKAEAEEEIVVTATRAEIPASETGIVVDVIEPGWGERSAEAALRKLPTAIFSKGGLQGQQSYGFLRGCKQDQTLVAVDGYQINRIGGEFDFARLDLAGVEKIEVMRGSGSVLYGSDAIAGVVNLILRTGERPSEMASSFEGGTEGSAREEVFLGGKSEDSAYGLTVQRYDRFGDLEYENSDYHFTTLAGKFTHSAAFGDLALSLHHFIAEGGLYIPWAGVRFVGEDPNDRILSEGSLVGIRWDSVKSGPFSAALSASRWEEDYGWMTRADAVDDLSDSDTYWDIHRTTFDLRGQWELENAKVWVGGEYELEEGANYSSSSTPEYLSLDRNNGAAYVQGRLELEDVKLDGGFRYEWNEYFGQAPTAFVGASWKADQSLRLHGTLSQGMKEPDFLMSQSPYTSGPMGDYQGNPDLAPEKSLSMDIGVGWSPDGRLKLDATYFNISITDLIVYTDTGLGYWTWENKNQARTQGVELTCRAKLREGLTLKVAGAWLDARAVDDGGDPSWDFEAGKRLLRRPGWTARTGLEWRPKDELGAYLELRAYGERDDADFSLLWPPPRVTLEPYVVCNLAFEWSFADNWRLTGRWENVGNTKYEEVFGNPAPGSRVFLGVNYSRRY